MFLFYPNVSYLIENRNQFVFLIDSLKIHLIYLKICNLLQTQNKLIKTSFHDVDDLFKEKFSHRLFPLHSLTFHLLNNHK